MALRGNLKDFTLPDVFQLISLSKKTGILRMRRPDDAEGSVWFREGEVFFAQSNWHRERLGERLVAAQKITPSALGRVLQVRAAEPEGRRLGTILVDEGYITETVLEAFVQEQIQDTIFDLMRWDDGEFDFELLPQIVEEDIGLTVSIENIVMEGSRRLEEWARIKKKVPSMDIVFKMATAPGEGTFEISLKPVEWNLLLLVDGTRSVAELARTARRTDFDVARVVYGLFSAGLLEVVSDEEVARLRAARAARETELAEEASSIAATTPVAAAVIEETTEPPAGTAVETTPAPSVPAVQAAPAQLEVMAAAESAPRAAPTDLPRFLAGDVPAAGPGITELEERYGRLREAAASVSSAPEQVPPRQAAPSQPLAPPEESPTPEPVVLGPEASMEPELPVPPMPEEAQPPFVESREDSELQPFVEPSAHPSRLTSDVPPAQTEVLSFAEETFVGTVEVEAPLESTEPVVYLGGDETIEEAEVPASDGVSPQLESELLALGLAAAPPQAPEPDVGVNEPHGVIPSEPELEESVSAVSGPESPEERAAADEAATSDLDELIGALGESAGDAAVSDRVLSTDAYLLDVSIGEAAPEPPALETTPAADARVDAGLSGAINDEINALTGVERGGRPVTRITDLPEPGSAVPQRDRSVDRETLLRIIDGIKRL